MIYEEGISKIYEVDGNKAKVSDSCRHAMGVTKSIFVAILSKSLLNVKTLLGYQDTLLRR